MSGNIINDIIKQLEMDNKRQANEMLKAAREQLGLSPTGQFVTQDSASSLLHDKAWVEQRGVASDSKKRKISSEISVHSKQRSGLLGAQTAKEIAHVRELYKDDVDRLTQEENKIKQQAKQAGALIKAQETDALKAVQELKSVSERRDNFAISRANAYAKVQEEVEKSNKKFQAEIEILSRQMASGAKVDKQVEDLRKRMSASYQIKTPPVSAKQRQAQFVAPQVDMTQLAQTNANQILDAYVEQSKNQVRQRASTSKKIGGQEVTPAQWKKGRYAFDTETTGVKAGDMPVTFGLGGYNEAGQKVIKDYFLSYGDKKKTSAKIIAAANVRDMNNQLIESAVQLRNRLGIAGGSDITSIDSDTWNKLVKPNLITPTQLVKELDFLGITSQTASDKLYSFNGKSFDIPMIDKWVSQYAKTTKTSGVAGSKLQDVLSKTVNNDIFQVLKETFRYTESHGPISKGDSILQADSSKANSRIKNSSTLQRFFSIVSGNKSSGAHGAGDDAASTIDVASWAMTTELFEGVASELESRVAAQGGNYKSDGYFTNQYKATINQALDQMVGVMDDQTSNPASQVVPNQVIVDKFKKLGKDVSNIANGKVSVDSLKQRLVSEYAKVGIGVKFEGNKVGLYPLKDFATPEEASWDKIASVEMAVLDGSGSLRRGQQAVANIVYPSHIFDGEGKRPTPVVYSSNEAQYMHLLKQIGANPDVETKLVQAIKGGNTDYASRIMDIGVKNVLSGVPTATTSTVRDEAVEQVHGMKNPEQMAAISGMFSTNEMAEELLRYKKSVVQQIYDQLHEAGVFKYQRTFDPNNLSQDEYSAVTTAYALIAQGYDNESVFQGDSLTKRLTLSQDFRDFQEEVRMFASQGLMPSVESLKEETVLSGFLTTSGAHDILPLNIFGDASNRALNQVFNYNERAFTPQMGSSMKFSSKVGRALGVDYGKAEMQQYTGATTDDSALLKALQELGLSLKYANVSVEEGGMVIPQRLADELASYRPATYKAYAEDIDPFFVSQTLGITPNSLDELAVGDTVRFNDLTIDESHIKSFSKDLSLTQGDVIIGLKKLADGFELITKRFETTKQGTKLLTEGGGRQTARVMANEDYDALVDKMGLSGANFLTENKTMASRSIMPALRGRLSYMIDEAFKQNPSMNMDEVLKVLKKTTQIGKSFSIGEDGKLQSSAFFDVKSKSYKYYDDSGELQDLITAGAGEDIDDVIRKAFVESAANNDFSKFGQALLGDNYSATLGLTSQFINMANEVPYYDPVGSGNADALESHGRVKVADRERRAATRTFSNAEAILISEGIEEGLRLFMQDEERQMNQYGKRGLQAQEQVKGLERAIATTAAGGYTNANDTYVELVYGASGALKDNQIDIKGMTTGFEYGEDGSGMTEEQYQNTIMGIARKKAAELGYKDVVLNYNGKKHLLGDIVSQEKHDGKYLPSVTDRANDSIFRALAQESAEIAKAAIAEVFNPQKGEYDRIAHDKDSSVFRAATESYLGNSSYAKVVGRNMALTSQQNSKEPEKANNVGVSREQLTGMLRSSRGSTTSDVAKNIRNLSYLLRSSGAKAKDYSDVDKLSSKSWDQLIKIENKIINNILKRMQSGGLSLLSQVHRYPSTSGQDIRYANLTLDDTLSGDAMSISRGLALTVNADYDGDKMWQRVLFANSDFDSYESFQKAQEAAKRIAQLDSQVSVLMQKWDDRQKSTPTDAKKAEDVFVRDLTNRGPNWLAALMSKTNKQYVGQFSNVSTNVRNFMQDFGMDEVAKSGTRSAGLSSIVRAYLESLEQDSISAKKVFGRLSAKNGEGAAIDELSSLYASVSQGDFEGATRKSEAMNLGFAESRQLEFAKSVMQVYQPELYEKEFKQIFESGDVTKIMDLVREGLALVTSTATAKGLDITDVTYNTKGRKIAQDKAKAAGESKTSSDAKTTASTVSQTKKKAEEMLREAQKATSAFKSGSFADKEGTAYTDNHYRQGTADGRFFEDENILSVTGLIGQYDKEIPAWEKEKMEVAAAKGTYAHKVAEILGRNQKLNLSEIQDESSLLELEQAQKELERALGFDATPELIDSLITRAQGLAKVASDEGLIGPNAQQEVTLGGVFDNVELQKAIAGQADIISTSKDGITVADYKFSSQGGPAMEAKRILQASIYLALYEKELQAELDKLNKQVENGDTSKKTAAKLKEVKGKLAASQYGRKIKILRSFEKNGEVFTEIVTTNAMSQEEALKALETLQTTKELESKLAEIEQRINSGIANDDDTATSKRIKERLASIGKLSTSQILSQAQGMKRVYKDAFGTVVGDMSDGSRRGPSASKLMGNYISNYKQQQRVQEKIQLTEQGMQGKSGEQLIAQQTYLRALQQQLITLQQQAPVLNTINGTINGEKLTKEQILEIQKKQAIADAEHLSRQAKINASQKQQLGFFGKLFGGLKNQLTWFIDSSLAYQVIGKVRQSITTLINTTQQLDASMVNIQIATGNTKGETRELMLSYVDLANELGRTTQSVAEASNDWLRAGYEGQQAAELTRASMMLSTLGMIEANQATTYLISTLKGWKLSASEVISVVDKLTAVDMAAAISAGDLALAMSRANNSARLAGSDMNRFIGYVTTVADVTQKSAESVGESFKTIYSRFGNVKANKFAATVDDQNSSDYNADNFENLNDIETVLTKVGIKLRENATTWRDIDTVIEDIANKWGTWDKTTQNAVATVVAGTRQRENVITLFENWDSVAKFSDIASDAYGTATKKMEAYTTSVEASKQRMTVAIEEWALNLNQGDLLRKFYDSLTYIIENLHTFGIVLSGLAILTNFNKIGTLVGSYFGKIATKTTMADNVFAGVKNGGGFKGGLKAGMEAFAAPLETARINRQVAQYGATLNKYNATLNEQQLLTIKNMQTDLLMLNTKDRKLVAETMSGNLIVQEIQTNMASMSQETQQTIASGLLANCKSEYRAKILKAIAADEKETLSTEELASAEKVFARELYRQSQKGVLRTVGENIGGSTSTEQTAKGSAIIGTASMIGSLLGGTFSSQLLSEADPALQILGTVGGSMLGQYAVKSLGTAFATSLAGEAVSFSSLFGPIGIAIGLALAGGFTIWKKLREKAIKEAAEDFKEESNKLSSYQNISTQVKTYDELSKGVDNLGRNVSLTDEQYQKFLDSSNAIANVFPDLVSRADEAGNKFIFLKDGVSSMTEALKEYIEEQKHITNMSLLEDTLFNDNYNKAKGSYDTAKSSKAELEGYISEIKKLAYDKTVQFGPDNIRSYYNASSSRTASNLKKIFNKYGYSDVGYDNQYSLTFNNIDVIEKIIPKIERDIRDYERTMSAARNSISNEVSALIEELAYGSYDLELGFDSSIFDNMSVEEDTIIQHTISKLGFSEDSETFKQDVANAVGDVHKIFEDNSGLLDLIVESENANTFGTQNDLRKQILDMLNLNGLNETEKKLLLTLDFEIKDGVMVDVKNTFEKIKEITKDELGANVTEDWYNSLSTNDANKVYEYYNKGILDKDSDVGLAENLLRANKDYTGLDGLYEKMLYQQDVFKDAESQALTFLGTIDKGAEVTANDIAKEFSKWPESMHNTMLSVAQDIANGGDIEAAINTVSEAVSREMTSTLEEVGTAINAVYFSGAEITGTIDTVKELSNAMESVAGTYEALASAQQEFAEHGSVSGKTAFELLSTDLAYTNVFDFDKETGKITLVKDAQKEMIKIRLASIKAQIKEAMVEKENAITKNEITIKELENIVKTGKGTVNQVSAKIEALNQESKAWALTRQQVAAYNAEVAGDTDLAKSILSEDWSSQVKLIDSNLQSITYTAEEAQDEIDRLRQVNTTYTSELNSMQEAYDAMGGDDNTPNAEAWFKWYDPEQWKEYKNALSDASEEALEKYLETLKKYRSLIDKEWEAMLAYDEKTQTAKPTEYYNKMRAQLIKEIAATEEAMTKVSGDDAEQERLDLEADLIELKKQLNNLDDEEIEDKIKIAQLEGASLATMKDLQTELIKSSDTYEEKLQYQKDYNKLLEDELQLVKAKGELIDKDTYSRETFAKNRGSLLDSSYYDDKQAQIENERKAIQDILANDENPDNKAKLTKEERLKYQKDLLDLDNSEAQLDDERIQYQIDLLKGQKADLSRVTAQYKNLIETADSKEEYYEYYQQYLDAFIAEFDDKISDVQRQIDRLEKARPQEWKSTINQSGKVIESATSKIKNYYGKMNQYYTIQKALAEAALKYSSELTEEEIEHLVDQANNAIKSIHDNAIAQAEDLKNYQESVYSALTNEVQRYIDDLEKQKEVVEETYNKELEKLQDKEDSIARTNKLIELQNNLLNAQKEKERVFRAGIGWTYESNREKVRTAENELNNFYRQDNIDDLNNAKDAELKVLDDRIKNWQKYLDMLNEKYKEYEVLEEKRLLKELLGVKTDAEIKATIVADMTNFTTEIGLNYNTFIANQSAFYLNYNSTFSSFLDTYTANLGTLASLKQKELSLLNSSSYSSVNLKSSAKSSSASITNAINAGMSDGEIAALKAAGDWYNTAKANGKTDEMKAAHEVAQKIREKYGYDGGVDGSANIPLPKNGYSSGIENGPVTYTGLAMLHGSPTEPEYVLNNDQAYNLLHYMATKKMPDFEPSKTGNSGIQYIVQGDIVLEGVDNPQEFWGEVTKAMGNRWNVTKNR